MTAWNGAALPGKGCGPRTFRPAKSIKSSTMLPARRTVLALVWVLPLVVFVAFPVTLPGAVVGTALPGVAW